SFFAISGVASFRNDDGNLTAPPLLIGLVGLAAETLILGTLVWQADHAPLALALFMLAMVEGLLIGWKRVSLAFLAPAAAMVTLLVLVTWSEVAFHGLAMDENGLWSTVPGPAAAQYLRWMLGAAVLFTLVGCLGTWLKPKPLLWGGLGGASAFLFVFAAWSRADSLLSATSWVVIAAAFAAGLLAAATAGKARHEQHPEAGLASGLLSIGAALLLLFAADRLFDQVWFTLAIAVLALAFAVMASVMRVMLQSSIAAGFGTLVTIRLFVSRHLWTDDPSLPWGQHWLLYGYGVPVIIFLLASRILKRANYLRAAMSLEGLSLGLVISLVSLEIRVLIAGGVTAAEPGLLEMSAHILTWLGAAYGLLYRQRIYSSLIAAWGARLLSGISIIAIVALSLLKMNPVFDNSLLQGGIFFNALLLAYLAPAVLLWLIARRLGAIGLDRFRPAVETLAVALVAVYLSMELKRLYAGPWLTVEPKDDIEAALHVLIWLALAAVLVHRGGFLGAQSVRWAGRGLITLAVLAIVFGGLGLYNPVVSGDPLSGNMFINPLLLTFLAPIGLIAFITRRLDRLDWTILKPAAGALSLVLAFAYLTLETKRVFQGPVMVVESLSIAESYAYSAVWLVFALALFVAGLRLAKQYVRYGGLGVMVLVVLKVFLLDMSNLEGLYRIASFVGLGLCLVGIGWLYQRFVQRPQQDAA
ncbi:MAG TPA: DUF2339 domain-containing protein, partial [Aestuariivirga sp.]|nr:DUF2339 domain-containing protein [Aestuariivirga sp.]